MTRASFDELLRRKLNECPLAHGSVASRCAFRIAWKEIRAAIVKGYTVKMIWEVLHESGRINIKYEWFSQLVSRQLMQDAENNSDCAAVERMAAQNSAPATGEKNSLLRKALRTSPHILKGAEAKRELSKSFGQARNDLSLDDFFGLTDKNVLDVLQS